MTTPLLPKEQTTDIDLVNRLGEYLKLKILDIHTSDLLFNVDLLGLINTSSKSSLSSLIIFCISNIFHKRICVIAFPGSMIFKTLFTNTYF